MSRRPLVGALAVLLAALPLSGCVSTPSLNRAIAPSCQNLDTLALAAQAVATSDRVPCIALLPAGWRLEAMDIRDGSARFWLSSDRAGIRALEVELTPPCTPEGATEIPSDEGGTRRFEKVQSVIGNYTGTRYYVFPGGCVTYRFRFAEEGRALLNEASLALTFVTRDELAAGLAEQSGGRLQL